jgi:hypothetical protein
MMRASIALLGFVIACGGGKPASTRRAPPPESPAGIDRAVIAAELVTIQALAERACACDDQACAVEIDAAFSTYVRGATLNDPITDIETWPADLDAIVHVATTRMLACMIELDHMPRAFGIFMLRKQTALRDLACACTDAACATRVALAHEALGKERVAAPPQLDDADKAEMDRAGLELRACVAVPLAEQAILDLKALRAEGCACTDADCAQDVGLRTQTWFAEALIGTSDEHIGAALVEIAGELNACLQAASAP